MKNYFIALVTILFFIPISHDSNKDALISNLSVTTDSLFFCQELLGRPTLNTITINACANKNVDMYYEYGTDSNNLSNQTSMQSCLDSIPSVFVLTNLNANTKYYYRMKYRETGTVTYLTRTIHGFRTPRPSGSTYTFAIEADPHLDTNSNPAVYALTLQNIAAKKPDFLIDLGDSFMSEKLIVQNPVTIRDRHLLLRTYFDLVCHSIPLFLVLGNHEGELGWRLDSTANNLPVWATNTRKLYYPNPEPNSFYSGDTIPENHVGLRQNYYSFQWGNALIVVLDPYWYTKSKPGWGWTLGAAQYNWFKRVLSTSTAKFKFVFCHNLVGGNGNDARGGTEVAHLFENGGFNLDSTWGFGTYRPGWQKTIHALLVENKATLFHGHDHFFGFQIKDGIIYQEVPQPSSKSFTQMSNTAYGYLNGVFIPSRGYLSVTVSNTSAKVEYIRTYLPSEENTTRHNGDVSYSYTIDTSGFTTSINESNIIPDKFTVSQNYPNPFNPGTSIKYTIPEADVVRIKIYDVMGREVVTLVDEFQRSGEYTVSFNTERLSLASGVYFYKVVSGNYSKTLKMFYLK